MTPTTQACQHLWTTPDLEALYTLDQHVHLTDGLVRCKTCPNASGGRCRVMAR